MTAAESNSFTPAELAACWFLTGPTASGKTAVGLELAERLGAEILSLDSMAVYRGMDIGTAKPTAAERQRVPHHLIDLVDPPKPFSVADYLAAAAAAAREIRARGREVLLVGGTPFYLKALLQGISSGPAADWTLRRELLETAERLGGQAMHDRLAAIDPVTAARLHPNDVRRVVRAIEVFELSGRPMSAAQADWQSAADSGPILHTLTWPREILARRIAQRVQAMFEAGLVDEVRGLVARYGSAEMRDEPLGRTASQAVGYLEVLDLLAGKCNQAEAIERIVTRTRQFAKRQMTWFRSLPGCRLLELSEPFDAPRIAEQIMQSRAV